MKCTTINKLDIYIKGQIVCILRDTEEQTSSDKDLVAQTSNTIFVWRRLMSETEYFNLLSI